MKTPPALSDAAAALIAVTDKKFTQELAETISDAAALREEYQTCRDRPSQPSAFACGAAMFAQRVVNNGTYIAGTATLGAGLTATATLTPAGLALGLPAAALGANAIAQSASLGQQAGAQVADFLASVEKVLSSTPKPKQPEGQTPAPTAHFSPPPPLTATSTPGNNSAPIALQMRLTQQTLPPIDPGLTFLTTPKP